MKYTSSSIDLKWVACPEPELHALAQALETAYQRTVAHFPTNAAVRIDPVKGRDTLTLTGLDTLDEPPRLLQLRDAVFTRLPRVNLPEVLLEIHARTGFAHAFTHISEGAARPLLERMWNRPLRLRAGARFPKASRRRPAHARAKRLGCRLASPRHHILDVRAHGSRPYVALDDGRVLGSPRRPGRAALGQW
jgi:hypothetical protein